MSQLGHGPLGGVPIGGTSEIPALPEPPENIADSIVVSDQLQGISFLLGTVIDVLSIGFVSEESKIVALSLAEDMQFDDTVDPRVVAVLVDQMFASGSFSYSWEGFSALADEIGINDTLAFFLSDTIEESITVSDLWSHYGLVLALADALRVTEVVSGFQETRDLLADAFTIKDLNDWFIAGELVDAATVADTYQLALQAINSALDGMTVSDDSEFSLTVTALVHEDVALIDATDTIGELANVLEDGLVASVYLATDTGVYDAWTMNTMTTGVSRYDNQPFNSFALHSNQKYIGATDDGIFELEGGDDDGTSIQGLIKSGLMDFGTTLNKRIQDFWVVMATDGSMLLKMTTTDGVDKSKIERWYRVVETPNMYRAKMAKGVKAKYWQFQLENIDSADFDIDQIALRAVPLSRRH